MCSMSDRKVPRDEAWSERVAELQLMIEQLQAKLELSHEMREVVEAERDEALKEIDDHVGTIVEAAILLGHKLEDGDVSEWLLAECERLSGRPRTVAGELDVMDSALQRAKAAEAERDDWKEQAIAAGNRIAASTWEARANEDHARLSELRWAFEMLAKCGGGCCE